MKPELTPGEVIRLEGLDLPPGARFHYVNNGSQRLRVMTAPSVRSEARGSIILQPGRTEFIEKFFETVEDFLKLGFAVLVLDPRGQGLSGRILGDPMKSYVDSFDDYSDDLSFVIKTFADDLPKPHILVGHSMGGTIVLQSILSGRTHPAACVCTAPMLALHELDSSFLSVVFKFLSWAGMRKKTLPLQAQRNGRPVSFRANKLTSDPNRYQLWATYFENHPRLRLGAPTYGWIAAAMSAMKFINDNAAHLKIPSLIIACGADPIVTPASNSDFAQAAGSDLLNVAGALHEIFLEKDEYRDQFWAAFNTFLEKNAL